MNLRSLRLFALIVWEYLKRKWLWVLTGVAVFAVLALLQFKFNLFYSANVLRIGLIGTYQEHDLPAEVTELTSKGLVEADSDNRIKPNLINGWEVNNDATQFKFKLKENLKWSDNTPLKASDLVFPIPNTTVSYPDDKTVQFNLKESYSPFPSLLTKPVFKKGTLLGIGPYHISRVEKSRIFITKIIMQADDPNLPVVYVRFYPTEKVAVTGFNLGEVQAIFGLSNPKAIEESGGVTVKQKTDYSKIVTVLYQTTDKLLSSRSLRQALSYQIPQASGEAIANNPYPPSSWAYDSASKKYFSNEKEAEEAMERAKSTLADSKLQSEILLTTTPNLSYTGETIVKAWKKLGFDAKLRVESGIPQNFQALLITQSIPQDPDQYYLWHATQNKTNLTKYDSKRVDKDLEDGRKIIKEEERREKYFDFQKTLLEDAPAAFLYFPKYNIIYLKKVEPLLNKLLNKFAS